MSKKKSAAVLGGAPDAGSDQKLRIVSIGAHPADVFDQSGGTMLHHTARGDYVACISLTHGARVHDAVISEDMFHRKEIPEAAELTQMIGDRSDVKAQEVRKACKILGIDDVYFMGIDDSIMLVERDTVRRLARLLRQIRPDIILTHYPFEGDGHVSSHAVGGQIVMHAAGFAGSVDPGDRNPPLRTMQTFFFGDGAAHVRNGLWDARGGYTNDVFVDITDVIDKKFAAMECLVSQGYAGVYNRKRIEHSDGAFGGGSFSYGEGFIRAGSEKHYYLPITADARQRARSSDHEVMRHYSWRMPMPVADTMANRPPSLKA
ncbi:MAG: PIG-L family deacetylase [Kiritimatiellaeota bacterium]|nr:PIG-L family deacetylase [Kiritimatiellota bacterium]